MASINQRSDGSRFIEFLLDGKRKTISVGSLPLRSIETIKGWVEKLVVAKYSTTAPDAETARWLGKIDEKLAKKLAKVGLIDERQPAKTLPAVALEAFLKGYI